MPRMKINSRSLKILFSIVPISILISSCDEDLSAARDFGLMAAEFQDSTSKLSADIYNSCVRKTQFYTLDTLKSQELQETEVEECNNFNKPTAGKVATANQVMVDYMIAIGELASDNTVDFNSSLDDIRKALNSITATSGGQPILKIDDVDAGINIAGFVINIFKKQFQRSELKPAILCTDDSVQTYSQGLISVFQDGYINNILEKERLRINDHYNSKAATYREYIKGDDDLPPLRSFAEYEPIEKKIEDIEKNKRAEINEFLKVRDAASAYVSVINKTALTHAKLKGIFNQDEDQAFQSKGDCEKNYFKADNGTNYLASPSNLNQISRQELRQINKIASEYNKEVKPLLKKINNTF